MEKLVKADHVFRKLNKIIDFEDLIAPYRGLYSDTGKKGVDVIKGFKALLVQFWEDCSDREMEKAMKEVDFEKIQREVKESIAKIDMEKIREEMEEVKKINMKGLEEEMTKVKKEMEKIGPQIEKEMQKAKKEIEKAKAEIKEYKEFVDGLDKDGLIKKSEGYTIKHEDGELIINGKKASNETYLKYKSFLEKHKKFNIEKSDDDFDIDMD
jgi:hypothetical protein